MSVQPAAVRITTKLELAVEAIESLANAVYTLRQSPDADRAAVMLFVTDAREECANALRSFLEPTLRVVS